MARQRRVRADDIVVLTRTNRQMRYNEGVMAEGKERSKPSRVTLSILLNRLGRSPELTKLLLLLLVWGQVRARPGYTTLDVQSGPKPTRQASAPKGKGFSIKRPRQRFL